MKTLPLFPLPLVFFPGTVLPLQIFEIRYRRMVKELLANNGQFVILHTRSPGTSSSDFETIGTLSKIIDWQPMQNQMIGIQVAGEQRVEISGVTVESDGLLMAEAIALISDQGLKSEQYSGKLDEISTLLGHHPLLSFRSVQLNAENVEAVSYQLASLIPFSGADKQRLLELDSSLQRLEMILSLLKDI
ncbi:LON peptidase substrate-binding domain-containing protein [Amphritea japonica]|uniref:ATP-dependent protease n=1 Tax=Amphritea japonica ATCC BAA-1530 TaxID=1278309 RepID=A0A7R6PBS5_9GAMM|nr:LON peptidase substrate-binding domain-containing protein [Amphritea japonica]BBB26588.1 ATP-dependent protease [Amphritea japonica ATCC BAA-1530]